MKKNKFIKAITLSAFIFFIAVYLLFKMGKFDAGTTRNKPAAATNAIDSTKTTGDSLGTTAAEATLLETGKPATGADTFKLTRMMSGSKSGPVMTPDQLKSLKVLHIDSLTIKKGRK